MNKITYKSKEIKNTQDLGKKIASVIRKGDLISLFGELGSGKTTLARSIINSEFFADNPNYVIPSPTFSLLQIYEFDKFNIFHADLYRLKNEEEINALNFEKALSEGALIVEWPEKLKSPSDANILNINFEIGEHDHIIKISNGGGWEDRIVSILQNDR